MADMLNENIAITCDICGDLMPLVKDGVACADSENAVKRHIESCKDCRELYSGEPVQTAEVEKTEPNREIFDKAKRRLTSVYAVLMMLGIYFGLSLTAGREMFFNCLIMPAVGILGYLIFKKKALGILPLLIFAMYLITDIFNLYRLDGRLGFTSVLSWSAVYSVFAVAGIILTMLLKYAFGKDE